MAGDSFGKLFTVTSFGESHGPALGCIVTGCPPGLELTEADLQKDLDRRRPGRSRHVTQRKEPDAVRILSGVFEGVTTGTAIGFADRKTWISAHATTKRSKTKCDPGMRITPTCKKYGIRDYRGGGRASARARRQCAWPPAALRASICMSAWAFAFAVISRSWAHTRSSRLILMRVDSNPFFCADPGQLENLEEYMIQLRRDGDSIGARINIIASGMPVGSRRTRVRQTGCSRCARDDEYQCRQGC